MAWTEQTIQKVMAEGGQKATTDKAFRKLALTNPNEAIKQLAGETLPEGFTVRFVENDGANLTIVLPDFQGEELADADLEQVAGGAAMGFGTEKSGPGMPFPGGFPGGPGGFPGNKPRF